MEAKGFKTVVNQDLELTVGVVQRVDFRMELGTAVQAITVEASAPLVNTEEGRLSSLVGASEVSNPIRLSWTAVGGVSVYRVFYDTVNPPTQETSPCIGTDACFAETTSFTLPTLRPDTTYYWMVYATRDPGCQDAAGSEVRSFTTASTVRQHPVRRGD